ncbi:predicted protein [Naegleria gruberi]|uniref:Cap-specific mRNA (nucleoside-2'-O-)-methyltransferase n=1 Tax=Naegleria gruberi TaxID=5762 RepID=D2VMH7_NAEGR|nr:uncharacterized protein NAEGRDRAFT_70140 [Naegleria gruberi]EFC42062.1 predicted protein [Naegleria gruberi]|eukprot:XP_002674806.1 predicted protein [Naegleria gruberi strain NEG-M]
MNNRGHPQTNNNHNNNLQRSRQCDTPQQPDGTRSTFSSSSNRQYISSRRDNFVVDNSSYRSDNKQRNYQHQYHEEEERFSVGSSASPYQDRKPIKARNAGNIRPFHSSHVHYQEREERPSYGRQEYYHASASSSSYIRQAGFRKRDEDRYSPPHSYTSSYQQPQGRVRFYHQFNRAPNQFVLSYRKKQYENYEWPDKKSNPHCEQILHYNDPHIEEKPFDRTNRILQPHDPQETYRRRKSELKSVIHWGQRKLLMSEIEFLTEFGYPGAIVVYAGAAPGHHTNFLSDLFPDLSFVLVDPSPFVCKPTDKITIVNDFFTDELAAKYADKNVLFISDIRTAQPEKGNENQTVEHREEIEKCVKWDNQAQMNWHLTIKPKMSMLKFRLPYDTQSEKSYEYLKGDIYLPVWGPQTTTETRLVCSKDCGTIPYDTAKYESQMFYFNTRTRVHYYPHNVQVEGMDHCYDCRSEVFILEQYLKKYKKIENESELLKQIAELSNLVSRNCTTALGAKVHNLATYEKNFRKDEVKKNLASIYETDRIKVDRGENKRSVEEMEDLRQKALKSMYKKTKL